MLAKMSAHGGVTAASPPPPKTDSGNGSGSLLTPGVQTPGLFPPAKAEVPKMAGIPMTPPHPPKAKAAKAWSGMSDDTPLVDLATKASPKLPWAKGT